MQTYPIFCTLKKNWVSHRGNSYPAGTTFKRDKKTSIFPGRPDGPGHWYEFRIPKGLPFPHQGGSFGFLFVPNKVFFLLTEEEKELKRTRKILREKHMKSYESI